MEELFMRYFQTCGAAGLALALALGVSHAETPKDTLVIASQIDDVVSMDPAEGWENSSAEVLGSTYERLMSYDFTDVSKIYGNVAENWALSANGRTLTFKIKQGQQFASGNPITADDVVFSFQRVVVLDKPPAFILGQFGLTKDNVAGMIKKISDYEFSLTTDQAYAPSFVLYCLATASVASIVDKKVVLEHEVNGDLGYGWLKTHSAGSGRFVLRDWRANDIIILDRNDAYSGEKAPLAHIIYRHIPEASTQRVTLTTGDIDVARNLGSDEIEALQKAGTVDVISQTKPGLYYLGLNQADPNLSKPEVREALRYLVDYDAIADTILNHKVVVHQNFVPAGILGAIEDRPYKLDVAKAKDLLKKAGLADGFSVTMDVRNDPERMSAAQQIQQAFRDAGIKLEILAEDDKQLGTRYRARKHQIVWAEWGSDYPDPHSNTFGFAANPDNSDKSKFRTLAWRNSWADPEFTAATEAAWIERDSTKRAKMYADLQRQVLASGPYVIMFQKIEVAAVRKNVHNFVLGPVDLNGIAMTSKD
jgi:peptide/nickel transport system substrate-binding protein